MPEKNPKLNKEGNVTSNVQYFQSVHHPDKLHCTDQHPSTNQPYSHLSQTLHRPGYYLHHFFHPRVDFKFAGVRLMPGCQLLPAEIMDELVEYCHNCYLNPLLY
jgi:hypothetical protein